jgi:serine/threonine protein kinase
LVVDPEQRLTVEQALAHPYLQALHELNIDDEPGHKDKFDNSFEKAATSDEMRGNKILKLAIIAKASANFKPKPLAKPQIIADKNVLFF